MTVVWSQTRNVVVCDRKRQMLLFFPQDVGYCVITNYDCCVITNCECCVVWLQATNVVFVVPPGHGILCGRKVWIWNGRLCGCDPGLHTPLHDPGGGGVCRPGPLHPRDDSSQGDGQKQTWRHLHLQPLLEHGSHGADKHSVSDELRGDKISQLPIGWFQCGCFRDLPEWADTFCKW